MIKRYSDNKIFEFIKKNRERVTLVTVVSIFVLSIGGGFLLQRNRSAKELRNAPLPKTVELKVAAKGDASGEPEGKSDSASFFLKPSPDELLQQLTSLENFNEDVVEGKYTGLRVLWPAYFFTLQSSEGNNKGTLVLDVTEDGFGVVIESEVDIALYPQLKDLEAGKKLWIGGEILAVDRSGTGTVYLKAENVSLSDTPPFPDIRQQAK